MYLMSNIFDQMIFLNQNVCLMTELQTDVGIQLEIWLDLINAAEYICLVEEDLMWQV